MSEYQYYEFQAIDRPLNEEDIEVLRSISSRANITSTSFTNHYNWGDFRGSPNQFMKSWFDLHLYLACWGTRVFMVRLPKRLIDRALLDMIISGCEFAEVIDAGENLIIETFIDEEEFDYWDNGSGWLTSMASLRADMLDGVWRLPYLIWLLGVEIGSVSDDEREPITGIGPLTGGMTAFADFFGIDTYLVEAAAEMPANFLEGGISTESVDAAVESIPEKNKTEFLQRLFKGDPHAAADLRRQVRDAVSTHNQNAQLHARTVAEIRARSIEIRKESEAAQEKRKEAERLKREQQAAKAQRVRIEVLRKRGESVWQEIDIDVSTCTYKNYDRAAEMLYDLQAISKEDNTTTDFQNRLHVIVSKHGGKQQFIKRLKKYDLLNSKKR